MIKGFYNNYLFSDQFGVLLRDIDPRIDPAAVLGVKKCTHAATLCIFTDSDGETIRSSFIGCGVVTAAYDKRTKLYRSPSGRLYIIRYGKRHYIDTFTINRGARGVFRRFI